MRETCCNLFGEKGKGQRLTLFALCELGQGLNITSSYFFRIKSNRSWPSGHGLLPKNTVTKFLNNIRISLSNGSRVQRWKKSKGIYCLGKNLRIWLFQMMKECFQRPAWQPGWSRIWLPVLLTQVVTWLLVSPVLADCVHHCPRGNFCHVDWSHPYDSFALWLKNRFQLPSIPSCLLWDFKKIASMFKNWKTYIKVQRIQQ